ncbi:MAG: hypothetical protein Q9211_000549 [Gyalolechia sp. 1 TL-2023]
MTAAVTAAQYHDHKESTSNINVAVVTRSASSNHLPGLARLSSASKKGQLPRTFSDSVLAGSHGHPPVIRYKRSLDSPGRKTEDEDEVLVARPHVSDNSDLEATILQPPLGPLLGSNDETLETRQAKPPRPFATDVKSRSMSRSLSRLAGRSWMSSSRSPSPSPSKHGHRQNVTVPNEALSLFSPSSSGSALNTQDAPKTPKTLAKAQRRPLSTFIGKASPESAIPSVPAIPKSFSTDKLPLVRNRALERAPTVPTSASVERLQGLGWEPSRKKDELWSVFRALDGDFQKFQSRTSTLKTAVVRSTLLPFLRTHADHLPNNALRPEDLDRRVNILNRWWTGLLEMLNGRNGESVSGSDRPTILEAITSIMARPEWSIPYLDGRFPRPLLNSRSTTSLGSTSSDFLAESVFHNARNLFVQNLLSQMAYVVEKMSARNVPASVVTFCGKATAYAFFYCDSVAEILVRLWSPSQETIRRVLAEHHLEKDADLKDSSNSLMPNFPRCLHGLAFNSVRATMRHLRSRPQLPITMAYIPWQGPWAGRWAGRDTDLFFGFTKSYFNLLNVFLPPGSTSEERLCAPGYVLLQGQMLTVLDGVIQNSNSNSNNGQPFADPLYAPEIFRETDASASVLPLPPAAINRSMAEHRLIILLRDCLSGSALTVERVRQMFAESFERLLKASARRTSMFNHNACFSLCDCMEEALAILMRYFASAKSDSSTLDWPFWLKVCRQMLESQHTMTEIRLYAFLYSLWTTITAEENRKRQVCLEWLLDEECFEKQFNHWCPMVRAYYMRLLCWRIGRSGDSSSMLDNMILKTLTLRLHRVWANFLYLQDNALNTGRPRLSTAPCSPAPSRHLLIIRNDSQPAPGGMFLTFDSILSPSSSTVATAYERHGSMGTLLGTDESYSLRDPPSIGKKSWSLLRNMMPFAVSTVNSSKDISRHRASKSRSGYEEPQSKTDGSLSLKSSNSPEGPAFRAHSFKFSLEWIDSENVPFGKEQQIYAPRLPLLSSSRHKPPEFTGSDKEPVDLKGKYAGRALAEWDLLIDEFQDFFKRRIAEGVPNESFVETPTLGVETFRRPG